MLKKKKGGWCSLELKALYNVCRHRNYTIKAMIYGQINELAVKHK